MKKTQLFAILAFLAVFLVGGVSGYFVGRESVSVEESLERPSRDGERPQVSRSPEEQQERMRRYMVRQLELTTEQEAPFFERLIEGREESRKVYSKSREILMEEMETQHQLLMEDLSEILTPEQLEKFRERFSRRAMHERRGNQQRQWQGQGGR